VVGIITLQEVFNGWIGSLNQPNSDRTQIVWRYHQLWSASDFFKTMPILEFDERAYDRYNQILNQSFSLRKKRLQKDIRIAALAKPLLWRIALVNDATIVTRNKRDFELVPGFAIEDWSN
jgi:tRNA(fMet)-specific endonuclease VapC